MKNRIHRFLRATAIATLIAYIPTSIDISYAASGSIPLEVVVPSSFKIEQNLALGLPAELGRMDSFQSGSKGTILHIQTAHGHYEAQEKIEKLLGWLSDKFGYFPILLEGAADQLDPARLEFFPGQPEANLQNARWLAKKSLVTGPELFLLQNKNSTGIGVESEEAYRKNHGQFARVLRAKKEAEHFSEVFKLQMEKRAAVFTPELRAFLKRLEQGALGIVPLDIWLPELRRTALKYLNLDLNDAAWQVRWPMMVRFFKIQSISQEFNSEKFEAEKKTFLIQIKKYLPASGSQSNGLYEQVELLLNSMGRSVQLPDPETENAFTEMLRFLPADFDFESYREVGKWIALLVLQSQLDFSLLAEEINRLESLIAEKLARGDDEKELLKTFADYRLLEKLLALQLTPSDFDKVNAEAAAQIKPSMLAKRLSFSVPHLTELDIVFDEAVSFYRGAKLRDEAMIERAHGYFKQHRPQFAVLVTGGFHSKPMREHFEKAGYTYVVVTPAITGLDEAGYQSYLKAMLASSTTQAAAPNQMIELPLGAGAELGEKTRGTQLTLTVQRVRAGEDLVQSLRESRRVATSGSSATSQTAISSADEAETWNPFKKITEPVYQFFYILGSIILLIDLLMDDWNSSEEEPEARPQAPSMPRSTFLIGGLAWLAFSATTSAADRVRPQLIKSAETILIPLSLPKQSPNEALAWNSLRDVLAERLSVLVASKEKTLEVIVADFKSKPDVLRAAYEGAFHFVEETFPETDSAALRKIVRERLQLSRSEARSLSRVILATTSATLSASAFLAHAMAEAYYKATLEPLHSRLAEENERPEILDLLAPISGHFFWLTVFILLPRFIQKTVIYFGVLYAAYWILTKYVGMDNDDAGVFVAAVAVVRFISGSKITATVNESNQGDLKNRSESRKVQDQDAYDLRSDDGKLEMMTTNFGAAGLSLKVAGGPEGTRNLIWQKADGNEVVQTEGAGQGLATPGGIPFMSENGRTVNGKMLTRDGRAIDLMASPLTRKTPDGHKLHGASSHMAWKTIAAAPDSVTYATTTKDINLGVEGAETMADIEGDVRYEQSYSVVGGVFQSSLTVENIGDQKAVLGGGYHPFYQLTDIEDWTIQIPAHSLWAKDSVPLPLDAKDQPIQTGSEFDYSAPRPLAYGTELTFGDLRRDENGDVVIILRNKKTREQIEIKFKEYQFSTLLLWVPPKESAPAPGVFSVEPLFTPPNGRNMYLSGNTHVRPLVLDSGKSQTFDWSLSYIPQGADFRVGETRHFSFQHAFAVAASDGRLRNPTEISLALQDAQIALSLQSFPNDASVSATAVYEADSSNLRYLILAVANRNKFYFYRWQPSERNDLTFLRMYEVPEAHYSDLQTKSPTLADPSFGFKYGHGQQSVHETVKVSDLISRSESRIEMDKLKVGRQYWIKESRKPNGEWVTLNRTDFEHGRDSIYVTSVRDGNERVVSYYDLSELTARSEVRSPTILFIALIGLAIMIGIKVVDRRDADTRPQQLVVPEMRVSWADYEKLRARVRDADNHENAKSQDIVTLAMYFVLQDERIKDFLFYQWVNEGVLDQKLNEAKEKLKSLKADSTSFIDPMKRQEMSFLDDFIWAVERRLNNSKGTLVMAGPLSGQSRSEARLYDVASARAALTKIKDHIDVPGNIRGQASRYLGNLGVSGGRRGSAIPRYVGDFLRGVEGQYPQVFRSESRITVDTDRGAFDLVQNASVSSGMVYSVNKQGGDYSGQLTLDLGADDVLLNFQLEFSGSAEDESALRQALDQKIGAVWARSELRFEIALKSAAVAAGAGMLFLSAHVNQWADADYLQNILRFGLFSVASLTLNVTGAYFGYKAEGKARPLFESFKMAALIFVVFEIAFFFAKPWIASIAVGGLLISIASMLLVNLALEYPLNFLFVRGLFGIDPQGPRGQAAWKKAWEAVNQNFIFAQKSGYFLMNVILYSVPVAAAIFLPPALAVYFGIYGLPILTAIAIFFVSPRVGRLQQERVRALSETASGEKALIEIFEKAISSPSIRITWSDAEHRLEILGEGTAIDRVYDEALHHPAVKKAQVVLSFAAPHGEHGEGVSIQFSDGFYQALKTKLAVGAKILAWAKQHSVTIDLNGDGKTIHLAGLTPAAAQALKTLMVSLADFKIRYPEYSPAEVSNVVLYDEIRAAQTARSEFRGLPADEMRQRLEALERWRSTEFTSGHASRTQTTAGDLFNLIQIRSDGGWSFVLDNDGDRKLDLSWSSDTGELRLNNRIISTNPQVNPLIDFNYNSDSHVMTIWLPESLQDSIAEAIGTDSAFGQSLIQTPVMMHRETRLTHQQPIGWHIRFGSVRSEARNPIQDLARKVAAARFVGLIPVAKTGVEQAVQIGAALIENEIIPEIVFRGEAANTLNALRRLRGKFPNKDQYPLAAGTVHTAEQVQLAYDAGATVVISPGMFPEVIAKANQLGMLAIPGVGTLDEAKEAARLGAVSIKFFPTYFKGETPDDRIADFKIKMGEPMSEGFKVKYDALVRDGKIKFVEFNPDSAKERTSFDQVASYTAIYNHLKEGQADAEEITFGVPSGADSVDGGYLDQIISDNKTASLMIVATGLAGLSFDEMAKFRDRLRGRHLKNISNVGTTVPSLEMVSERAAQFSPGSEARIKKIENLKESDEAQLALSAIAEKYGVAESLIGNVRSAFNLGNDRFLFFMESFSGWSGTREVKHQPGVYLVTMSGVDTVYHFDGYSAEVDSVLIGKSASNFPLIFAALRRDGSVDVFSEPQANGVLQRPLQTSLQLKDTENLMLGDAPEGKSVHGMMYLYQPPATESNSAQIHLVLEAKKGVVSVHRSEARSDLSENKWGFASVAARQPFEKSKGYEQDVQILREISTFQETNGGTFLVKDVTLNGKWFYDKSGWVARMQVYRLIERQEILDDQAPKFKKAYRYRLTQLGRDYVSRSESREVREVEFWIDAASNGDLNRNGYKFLRLSPEAGSSLALFQNVFEQAIPDLREDKKDFWLVLDQKGPIAFVLAREKQKTDLNQQMAIEQFAEKLRTSSDGQLEVVDPDFKEQELLIFSLLEAGPEGIKRMDGMLGIFAQHYGRPAKPVFPHDPRLGAALIGNKPIIQEGAGYRFTFGYYHDASFDFVASSSAANDQPAASASAVQAANPIEIFKSALELERKNNSGIFFNKVLGGVVGLIVGGLLFAIFRLGEASIVGAVLGGIAGYFGIALVYGDVLDTKYFDNLEKILGQPASRVRTNLLRAKQIEIESGAYQSLVPSPLNKAALDAIDFALARSEARTETLVWNVLGAKDIQPQSLEDFFLANWNQTNTLQEVVIERQDPKAPSKTVSIRVDVPLSLATSPAVFLDTWFEQKNAGLSFKDSVQRGLIRQVMLSGYAPPEAKPDTNLAAATIARQIEDQLAVVENEERLSDVKIAALQAAIRLFTLNYELLDSHRNQAMVESLPERIQKAFLKTYGVSEKLILSGKMGGTTIGWSLASRWGILSWRAEEPTHVDAQGRKLVGKPRAEIEALADTANRLEDIVGRIVSPMAEYWNRSLEVDSTIYEFKNLIGGYVLSAPGWFDDRGNLTANQSNIANMNRGYHYDDPKNEFSISAQLLSKYGITLLGRTLHDGTAHAMGEMSRSYGTGAKNFVYLGPGSGMAHRVMVNGEPFTGGEEIAYIQNELPNYMFLQNRTESGVTTWNIDWKLGLQISSGTRLSPDIAIRTWENQTAGVAKVRRLKEALNEEGLSVPETETNFIGYVIKKYPAVYKKVNDQMLREMGHGIVTLIVQSKEKFGNRYPNYRADDFRAVLGGKVTSEADLDVVKRGAKEVAESFGLTADDIDRMFVLSAIPDEIREFLAAISIFDQIVSARSEQRVTPASAEVVVPVRTNYRQSLAEARMKLLSWLGGIVPRRWLSAIGFTDAARQVRALTGGDAFAEEAPVTMISVLDRAKPGAQWTFSQGQTMAVAPAQTVIHPILINSILNSGDGRAAFELLNQFAQDAGAKVAPIATFTSGGDLKADLRKLMTGKKSGLTPTERVKVEALLKLLQVQTVETGSVEKAMNTYVANHQQKFKIAVLLPNAGLLDQIRGALTLALGKDLSGRDTIALAKLARVLQQASLLEGDAQDVFLQKELPGITGKNGKWLHSAILELLEQWIENHELIAVSA